MGMRRGLVGRSRQLAQLQEVLPRPGMAAQAALVLGEAGGGKTRLLSEVARRAAADGVAVLRGSAVSSATDPLHPLLEVCMDAAATLPTDDVTLAPAERRWEVAAQLRDAVARLAPALVLVDDVQWAPDDTLWVLRRLVDDADLDGWTLLMASRPVVERSSTREAIERGSLRVRLPPLTVSDVAELCGPASPDPAEVVERSGGNPLLVHELLDLGIDADVSEAAAGTVGRRLDLAGSDVAGLMSVVAVAGPDTPVAVLADAVGRSRHEVADELARAERHELIVTSDTGRRFRHDLLAEVALDRLDRDQRAAIDADLARAWGGVPSGLGRRARTRHLVRAVPTVEPERAAETAVSVAEELVVERQPAVAAALAAEAATMLADHAPGASILRGRVLVTLAEAEWAAGQPMASMASGAEASNLLVSSTDAVLRARAEVAACRQHDTFQPSPERSARIADVLQELDGDLPVHAAMLGRAAALATVTPAGIRHGHELADRALAMARRLEDPTALVQALSDRYFCVVDPRDSDAREAVAEEIVELTRQAGRADLGLLGHQWRAGGRAARGDLDGATAALDELEALAAVRPDPQWQMAVLLRRIPLAAYLEGRDVALDLLQTGLRVGRDTVEHVERHGIELEGRLTLARLYQRPDDRIRSLRQWLKVHVDPIPPVAFIAVRMAHASLADGDVDDARRAVRRWATRSHEVVGSYLGLTTGASLASLVVGVRDAAHARSLAAALAPWAGRMPMDNGIGIDLPVDAHRARLLALAGDRAEALAGASESVALADRMQARVLQAQCLAILADVQAMDGNATSAVGIRDRARELAADAGARVPDPGLAAPGPHTPLAPGMPGPDETPSITVSARRTARLHRDTGAWAIDSPYGDGRLPDSVGMRQLAHLLASPGQEIAAAHLAGTPDAPPPARDIGPALDATAKRAYRHRIAELETAIDEADANADIERASRARAELDALLDQLRRAVGLAGRDRPQKSGDERARINATRTLRRAIAAIEHELPVLGAHLSASVRTGRYCSYTPEPAAALTWDVTR